MERMWWLRGMQINPSNGKREIINVNPTLVIRAERWEEALALAQKYCDPEEIPGLTEGEVNIELVEFEIAGCIAYI